jgi:hypothetical protein
MRRQWIIVTPLAQTPSVIHALTRVGKTTTQVWWFFYWNRHDHHFGDVGYDSCK